MFVETSIAQKRPIPISVLREKTVSKYPYWATRELLMNAIMHRDYESNAPVAFYEYDDRIEIQNAGGLYGKVSANNFPNVSDYRNPFIAEAMKVLGYVNRFSRGVYRVQKELEENGNGKASFDFSLITAFRVVEPISTTYFEEGFGEESDNELGESDNKPDNKLGKPDNKLGKSDNKLGESTNKTPIKSEETPNKSEGLPNKSDNKILRNIEHKIIKAIKENPRITRKELESEIIDERNSVRYYIEKLTKAGIIKREGAKKNGKWVVVEREELEK